MDSNLQSGYDDRERDGQLDESKGGNAEPERGHCLLESC